MVPVGVILTACLSQVASAPSAASAASSVIRGRVLAADNGRPLAHSVVTLTMDVGTEHSTVLRRSTTAAADGGFEFKGLAAGHYRLEASPTNGSQYLSAGYAVPAPDRWRGLDLSSGEVFDRATIRLPKGAIVSGRVVDDRGTPVSGVHVLLIPYVSGRLSDRGTGGLSSVTDDRGQFRLFGIRRGRWSLVAGALRPTAVVFGTPVRDIRPEGYLRTYFPDAADPDEAQTFMTAAGAEVGPLEIRMRYGRTFRVSGVATGPDGGPLASAFISVAPSEAFDAGAVGTSTDGAGRFAFENVAPGTIVVRATRDVAPPMTQLRGVERVMITTEDVSGVVVPLTTGARISGTIDFDEPVSQKQARNVTVMLLPDQGAYQSTMTSVRVDTSGRITFTLEPLTGRYRIILLLPGTWYEKSMAVNGREAAPEEPRAFGNGDHVTLAVSTHAPHLEVVATQGSGGPLPYAIVRLVPIDVAEPLRQTIRLVTDGHGYIDFHGLRPGRYTLSAAPGHDEESSLDDESADVILAGTPITLAEGDHQTVTVRVDSGGDH